MHTEAQLNGGPLVLGLIALMLAVYLGHWFGRRAGSSDSPEAPLPGASGVIAGVGGVAAWIVGSELAWGIPPWQALTVGSKPSDPLQSVLDYVFLTFGVVLGSLIATLLDRFASGQSRRRRGRLLGGLVTFAASISIAALFAGAFIRGGVDTELSDAGSVQVLVDGATKTSIDVWIEPSSYATLPRDLQERYDPSAENQVTGVAVILVRIEGRPNSNVEFAVLVDGPMTTPYRRVDREREFIEPRVAAPEVTTGSLKSGRCVPQKSIPVRLPSAAIRGTVSLDGLGEGAVKLESTEAREWTRLVNTDSVFRLPDVWATARDNETTCLIGTSALDGVWHPPVTASITIRNALTSASTDVRTSLGDAYTDSRAYWRITAPTAAGEDPTAPGWRFGLVGAAARTPDTSSVADANIRLFAAASLGGVAGAALVPIGEVLLTALSPLRLLRRFISPIVRRAKVMKRRARTMRRIGRARLAASRRAGAMRVAGKRKGHSRR